MNRSAELYKGQRQREKRELFRRFKHRDVAEIYKIKFFKLFDNRCFRCGASKKLDIDHHVPMTLGGHLVSGNLVALCKRCNNAKRDISPDVFYPQRDLKRLQPIFESQQLLFDFKWDWTSFNKDREAYFLALGVPASQVDKIFRDPAYQYFLGKDDDSAAFILDATPIIQQALQERVINLVPAHLHTRPEDTENPKS